MFSRRIDNLEAETQYCFAVQAYDAKGSTSPFSSEVCKTTPAVQVPQEPAPTPQEPAPIPQEPAPTPQEPTEPTEEPGGTTDAREIVVYASKATALKGNWKVAASSDAAGGQSVRDTDVQWSSPNAALASPPNYFEVRFNAQANTPYRVWLRLRAGNNSKWNDSVWVQFSGALVSGRAAYRIGTTSGLLINLQRCADCGMRSWGWFNSAYWLQQATAVTFATTGTQTLRVQTREDGVEIDQIVLSATKYMNAPPGPSTDDRTILAASPTTTAPAPTPTPTPSPTGPTPYSGTAVALPGKVEAAFFDNGGKGVGYHDSTSGNSGGVLRNTDVDIQRASDGGYNVGWITAGEWLTYSVNVSRAGTYTLRLRVAATRAGTLAVTTNVPSTVTRSVAYPNTGGTQKWTDVVIPITLAAGPQRLTLKFNTEGVNFRLLQVQ